MRTTVTLARQAGCGGSDIGAALAQRLDVRCLDREIVSQTARQLDCEEEEVAAREERGYSFWERMLRGISVSPPEALYHAPQGLTRTDREMFDAETEVMKAIASQEDCVIVGRLAAQVLPPRPGLVNVLLYAPLGFRTQRLIAAGHAASEAQAQALIAQSDGTRQRHVAQMMGMEWDNVGNYHLCLDTSTLPLPEVVSLLADFVHRRLAAQQDSG